MSDDTTIPHLSINSSALSTILFIHGASASPREFLNVVSYLPAFHSLVPSLPSHSQSLHIVPFTVTTSIDLLASLVRNRAKSPKVHVVGHSLGAEIALAFAAKYPELVETLYVSGFRRLELSSLATPIIPYIAFGAKHLEDLVPRSTLGRWLDIDFDFPSKGPLQHGIAANSIPETPRSVRLTKELLTALSSKDDIPQLTVRTLIVAATKGNWYLPTNDSVPEAKRLLNILKKGNVDSKAVQIHSMRHPWNLQDPELFARSLEAWIDRSEVLDGFDLID